MAALVVVLTQRETDARSVDRARRGALAAAPRIAREVLSYDYRTIGRDIARAERDTTGTFARQYSANRSQLAAAAIANRAIVQAQPQAPGIVSASAHEVVVLLFVDQVSVKQPEGMAGPSTRALQSRVLMTLREVDGEWLLAGLAGI